jgi:hypothetical protein
VRKNYREQKRIFDEALLYEDDNSNEIDPDEIDILVNDLFKLELNGKTLKSIVDSINSKAGPSKSKPTGSTSKYSVILSTNKISNRKRSPPRNIRLTHTALNESNDNLLSKYLLKQNLKDESDVSEK